MFLQRISRQGIPLPSIRGLHLFCVLLLERSKLLIQVSDINRLYASTFAVVCVQKNAFAQSDL
jgi:hypothetical protein